MSAGTEHPSDEWDATRRRVLNRDGHACRFCGTTDDEHRDEHDTGLHVHHVIPRNDGGSDDPDNLLAVCCRCHRTLEETHAKAVAEMKHREDYAEDLEGATRVWRDQQGTLDALEDTLAEFVDGHPTFAEEFGIFVRADGDIKAREFEGATATAGDAQIDSEWAFAVGWGYKEALLDAVVALDEWTGVPFDQADGKRDQDADTDPLDESGPYDPTDE